MFTNPSRYLGTHIGLILLVVGEKKKKVEKSITVLLSTAWFVGVITSYYYG